MLQKQQKKVEGECAICHEEMDERIGDITFCQGSCGQNPHEHCIAQWNSARAGPAACPLCREIWEQRTEDLIEVDKVLDDSAVQVYLDWLYTRTIRVDPGINRESDDCNVQLLKAWRVSVVMADHKFQEAIIAEHISRLVDGTNKGFRIEAVSYAYDHDMNFYMWQFVVDSVLAGANTPWFDNSAEKFPVLFIRDLCVAAMSKRSGKKLPKY